MAAVDNRNRRLFLGECKYHQKPVDVVVYASLQQKAKSPDLVKAFKDYEIIYGLFSKSGFTDRLTRMAEENSRLLLIQEDQLLEGRIPFDISLNQPNKETIAAMLEAERIAKDPSVKGYTDLDELFADLKS